MSAIGGKAVNTNCSNINTSELSPDNDEVEFGMWVKMSPAAAVASGNDLERFDYRARS